MGLSAAASRAARVLAPWGGSIGAALGWVVSDQTGSMLVFDRCAAGDPATMMAIGLVGLAIVAIGAVPSAMVVRRESGQRSARRFIAWVGLAMAALFAVAIALQIAAGLVIPCCYG